MVENETGGYDVTPTDVSKSAQDSELPFVAHFAASRWGITEWTFSKEEYTTLRKYAVVLHLNPTFLHQLDNAFDFIHVMARSIRTGAHNAITGICYDIAIRNYAKTASRIEKALVVYNFCDTLTPKDVP